MDIVRRIVVVQNWDADNECFNMLYCIVNWKQFFFGENYRENEKSFFPFFRFILPTEMWRDGEKAEGVSGSFRLFLLFFLFIITLTLYVFVCVVHVQHTAAYHTRLTNETSLFCYLLYWKYILLWCLRICSFRSRFMHNLRCNRAIHYHLLSTILTDNHELHSEQNTHIAVYLSVFSTKERSLFTLSIMCFDHTHTHTIFSSLLLVFFGYFKTASIAWFFWRRKCAHQELAVFHKYLRACVCVCVCIFFVKKTCSNREYYNFNWMNFTIITNWRVISSENIIPSINFFP